MTNYINEENFIAWFTEKSNAPVSSRAKLLDEVLQQYIKTRKNEFVLSADRTKSGTEESYPIKFENIGCCGASTYYIYF